MRAHARTHTHGWLCDITHVHIYTCIHTYLRRKEKGSEGAYWKHAYFSSSKTELQQRIRLINEEIAYEHVI